MIITDSGIVIRMDVEDISRIGRNTQGVKLMTLGDDSAVSTVAKVEKEEEVIEDEEDDGESSDTVIEDEEDDGESSDTPNEE